MSSKSLFDFFKECANEKHIDQKQLVDIFKKTLVDVIKKKFGEYYDEEHFNVNVNENNIQIEHYRDIVTDKEAIKENINLIGISEAKKIEKDFCIGEQVVENLFFDIFNRNEVSEIKRNIISSITILKQQNLYNEYSKLLGEIVCPQVHLYSRWYIITHDNMKNELLLPYSELIPGERLKKGSSIKALVKKVDSQKNNIVVTLSRLGNAFLKRILEFYIPEITDGLVIIKKIARIPGKRAKVVVESVDPSIDPIGACVGIACSRLNGILRELNGEIVDFVAYSGNKSIFVANVLGVKEIKDIETFKDRLFIYLDKDEYENIKERGQINMKLLKLLLDQEVDIFDYSTKDKNGIPVESLSDYIDSWIIVEMKNNNFLTIEDVFKTPKKDFEEKTDFEEETVDEIYDVINEEILKNA